MIEGPACQLGEAAFTSVFQSLEHCGALRLLGLHFCGGWGQGGARPSPVGPRASGSRHPDVIPGPHECVLLTQALTWDLP